MILVIYLSRNAKAANIKGKYLSNQKEKLSSHSALNSIYNGNFMLHFFYSKLLTYLININVFKCHWKKQYLYHGKNINLLKNIY